MPYRKRAVTFSAIPGGAGQQRANNGGFARVDTKSVRPITKDYRTRIIRIQNPLFGLNGLSHGSLDFPPAVLLFSRAAHGTPAEP